MQQFLRFLQRGARRFSAAVRVSGLVAWRARKVNIGKATDTFRKQQLVILQIQSDLIRFNQISIFFAICSNCFQTGPSSVYHPSLTRKRLPHGLPEQGRLRRSRGLRRGCPRLRRPELGVLGVLVAVCQVVPLAVVQPEVQWIGLRENLQETMVFTVKYRGFL